MNVTFYKNVTKIAMSTALPAVDGTIISCDIYGECDVKAPVIVLSKSAYNHEYNYAYIPIYGRYYYITGWAYRRGHYYASMVVDVCASFRSEIMSQTAYVTRSASQWDGSITDSYYPNTATPKTVKIYADDPNHESVITPNFANGTVVLGVIGGGTQSINGVIYYLLSPDQASALFSALMASLPAEVTESGDLGVSDNLAKMLYNPMQYVVSAMWIPVPLSYMTGSNGTSTRRQEIYCGYFATGVTGAAALNTPKCRITLLDKVNPPAHPQSERGSFLGAQPYTRAVFSYQCFPDIEIPDNLSQISNISADLTIDGITGAAEIELWYYLSTGDTDPKSVPIVSNTMSQMGVPLALSQVTASFDGSINSVGRLVVGNDISDVGKSLATGALGTLAWIGGNLGTLIAGAVEPESYMYVSSDMASDAANKVLGYDSVSNGVASSFLTYRIASKGTSGNLATLAGLVNDALVITYQILVDDDLVNRGRPLCKTVSLADLSGYTMIASPLRITGTAQESAALNDIASRGVYLE